MKVQKKVTPHVPSLLKHNRRQHGGQTSDDVFSVEHLALLLQMSLGINLAVVADVELLLGQFGLVVNVVFVVL